MKRLSFQPLSKQHLDNGFALCLLENTNVLSKNAIWRNMNDYCVRNIALN